MDKFEKLIGANKTYRDGKNVIKYLNEASNDDVNSTDTIQISYDLQAGSYIRDLKRNEAYNESYCQRVAEELNSLGDFESIMEIGVGEATVLRGVLSYLEKKPTDVFGFDISWSRLKFARYYLEEKDCQANLFAANLFSIPLPDDSIDVVYTSHSLEPNGGKEKEALQELMRVAKKYVVLLEPSFEHANEQGKKRMETNGYVKNLSQHAQDLGFEITKHQKFDVIINDLNPTALTIIRKSSEYSNSPELICPYSKGPLSKINDQLYFSERTGLSYPIIEQIPCLNKDNAILTTHLLTDCDDYIQSDAD